MMGPLDLDLDLPTEPQMGRIEPRHAGIWHLIAHCSRVHYSRMKNVTLSADEDLIEKARLLARAQRTTLNAAFREWLVEFTAREGNAKAFDALMKDLRSVNAGRHFTRDEMNER